MRYIVVVKTGKILYIDGNYFKDRWLSNRGKIRSSVFYVVIVLKMFIIIGCIYYLYNIFWSKENK